MRNYFAPESFVFGLCEPLLEDSILPNFSSLKVALVSLICQSVIKREVCFAIPWFHRGQMRSGLKVNTLECESILRLDDEVLVRIVRFVDFVYILDLPHGYGAHAYA